MIQTKVLQDWYGCLYIEVGSYVFAPPDLPEKDTDVEVHPYTNLADNTGVDVTWAADTPSRTSSLRIDSASVYRGGR